MSDEFLVQISDDVVEEILPGLALKILLLFCSMTSKKRGIVLMKMPTLKRLLQIKNQGEINKALRSLYIGGRILPSKYAKKNRHNIHYWDISPELRKEPFFCIPANHIATLVDQKKQAGRIMSLSRNELRLWLWLHREFSRQQIGGYDFRHSEDCGFLEIALRDAEEDLFFRIHNRLFEALEKEGLLRLLSITQEGRRSVLLTRPHFKPSSKPAIERGTIKAAANETRPVGLLSVRKTTSSYADSVSEQSSLVLDSDPSPDLYDECMDLINELEFGCRDAARASRLLRFVGPYAVIQSIRCLKSIEKEVTIKNIEAEIHSMLCDSAIIIEYPPSYWEEDGG